MTSREEFKQWHEREFGYSFKTVDSVNKGIEYSIRLEAWQASRAAIEVPEDVVTTLGFYNGTELDMETINGAAYTLANWAIDTIRKLRSE